MISCIIVDDEQHAIDLLTGHISKIPLLDLQFATTDPVSAFQYLQKKKADLVFLDIQMPELDGLQLARLLGDKTKLVFTTAYSEYALKGYEYNVIDYLLKPILFERFLSAAQKAIHLLDASCPAASLQEKPVYGDDFIFVKTGARNKIVRIGLTDIEYIEATGNYLTIHTSSGKLLALLTFRELEKKLPPGRFIRIHNSFLAPVNKITVVEGNQLEIGKYKLPIGEVYKKAFLNAIDQRIMKKK
jgi:two-component system, LytTR family, response regulator